jgi:hypothetical protein
MTQATKHILNDGDPHVNIDYFINYVQDVESQTCRGT